MRNVFFCSDDNAGVIVSQCRFLIFSNRIVFPLFVLKMVASILNPTKCEDHSVTRFLNTNCKYSAQIHRQITNVYGDIMTHQIVSKCCCALLEGKTGIHDKQRSSWSSLMSKKIEGRIHSDKQLMLSELLKVIL